MIFREWNGAYYFAVAEILKSALSRRVTKEEMRDIIISCAFSESILTVEPALCDEKWQLLKKDGTTVLKHAPSLPLSSLQLQWLKAVSLDPRIRLFEFDDSEIKDVLTLFEPDDIYVFDRYADGDSFEDEAYIAAFRLILDAIKNRYRLKIDVFNRKGTPTHLDVVPEYLEYSEKDDKFRLITSGCKYGRVVNLGRIISCKPAGAPSGERRGDAAIVSDKSVSMELRDERNALERAMLHFAHFEKHAERLDEKKYRIKIFYNRDDETELVIRVLSFGPLVRVTEPQSFVERIKERLLMQKSCELK